MATKKNATPETKSTKSEKKADAPSVVKVAALAKKHNMSPKAVRARFRRMYKNEDTRKTLPMPIGGVDSNGRAKLGWNFELKHRAEVEKLVSSLATAKDAE